MSDRFASLKSNNAFQKPNNKRAPPEKTNSRFDNLNEKKSNRFSYRPKERTGFNNRRNGRRNGRRDASNNNVVLNRIGKFTQVGTGEVSFVPQLKCGKISQKNMKKERKKEKLKVINKKEDDEDWKSLQTEEDIALTLAMAQKYQYVTESDEEEEEGENNEVENTDTDFDNSAW
jgi:hypothetical protein